VNHTLFAGQIKTDVEVDLRMLSLAR